MQHSLLPLLYGYIRKSHACVAHRTLEVIVYQYPKNTVISRIRGRIDILPVYYYLDLEDRSFDAPYVGETTTANLGLGEPTFSKNSSLPNAK
ncbi:hypothetical protein BV898_16869 [Hypsibius exemplaris]|uniref:Uncharacterized protein n=1 Tax=Hypsibius exemplaris TaxID=2072580 RepID=A0A9X6NEA9_HYPEX|nr:hypothetical protein BV898_16869 [Hypsibius exemplaris]